MGTIRGTGVAPALVLAYVRRLPDTSLTHALQHGGMEHFGWGQDRHIAADIYDAITYNTEVTGQWVKPVELPHWPRPKSNSEADASESKPRRSVKDLWNAVKR